MKSDHIRRVGVKRVYARLRRAMGALLRAVPTRGHGAGVGAGSFAHPTIRFERNVL
jgi:hypothetical protein